MDNARYDVHVRNMKIKNATWKIQINLKINREQYNRIILRDRHGGGVQEENTIIDISNDWRTKVDRTHNKIKDDIKDCLIGA